MTVKKLAVDAIYLSLLIVSAMISFVFPITEISFTLQVLVVFLLIFTLPLKDTMLIILAYLVMGIIGLPVFAGATGGFSKFVSPTFGYLLGFMFMPLVVLPFKKIIKNEFSANLIGGAVSLVVLYVFGAVYFYCLKNLYLDTPFTFANTLKFTVIPFIPYDLSKLVIAAFIALKLKGVIVNLK